MTVLPAVLIGSSSSSNNFAKKRGLTIVIINTSTSFRRLCYTCKPKFCKICRRRGWTLPSPWQAGASSPGTRERPTSNGLVLFCPGSLGKVSWRRSQICAKTLTLNSAVLSPAGDDSSTPMRAKPLLVTLDPPPHRWRWQRGSTHDSTPGQHPTLGEAEPTFDREGKVFEFGGSQSDSIWLFSFPYNAPLHAG